MKAFLLTLFMLYASSSPVPLDNPSGTRKVLVIRPKGCGPNRTSIGRPNGGSNILSTIANSIPAAEDFLTNEAETLAAQVVPFLTAVEDEASDVLAHVETTVSNAAGNTTGAIASSYAAVRQNLRVAANQTKELISQTAQKAEGSVSSVFQSTKEWFTNLEEDVKEILHLGVRILEVVVSVALLVVFLWILRKTITGYRFVKGIAETFELHDRPQNH